MLDIQILHHPQMGINSIKKKTGLGATGVFPHKVQMAKYCPSEISVALALHKDDYSTWEIEQGFSVISLPLHACRKGLLKLVVLVGRKEAVMQGY